jgi:PD-(D/E)XK nuclease superfamily
MDTILGPEVIEQLRQAFEPGLTQSEMMTRQNCARKWYFRYVLLKKKQGSFSWPLVFGDAVHRMLERYYRGNDDALEVPDFRFEEDIILRPDQTEDLEYWRGLASLMVRYHCKFWREFDDKMELLATEEEIHYEYRGFTLRGKIDLCIRPSAKDGIFPMDHKTTYIFDDSVFAGWSFRFQFLYYAWLWWRVKGRYPAGMYVNAIRKPAEKRTKKETVQDWLNRIEANIKGDPWNYFKRERLPFDRTILQRFEKYTLDPIITQYELLGAIAAVNEKEFEDRIFSATVDSLLLSMNTDHCHAFNRSCEFLELCSHDMKDHAAEYITMQHKHPELAK